MMSLQSNMSSIWLACLCALASQGALAQASGSMSLSNVGYVLTDLDPDDGIAPALTWTSGALTNYLSLGEQIPPFTPDKWPRYKDVFTKTETIDDQAHPSGSLAHGEFRTTATEDGGEVSFVMPMGGRLILEASYLQGFQLTPHTLVTFNGHVQGTFAGSVPASATYPHPGETELFYVDVRTGATLEATRLWDVGPSLSANNVKWIGGSLDFPQESTTLSVDTLLSVSLANSKDVPMAGQFKFAAFASGITIVPVPEASTTAQMLLGGAVLGALAWRRRQFARSAEPGAGV